MLKPFLISSLEYQNTKPYPYYIQDDILDMEFAKMLQNEILNIPSVEFDRYNNPFEQKFTLRNKQKYPYLLNKLISYLESDEFVNRLSQFTGFELVIDKNRNFNGVHLYNNGDKLDIHLDAAIHPYTKELKIITLGIYLSSNWKPEYECSLEIWSGDSGLDEKPKLYECINKIAPLFNRLIIFTNSDISWHGNPDIAKCSENSKRIFLTVSYLSKNKKNENLRQKALFISRPNDPYDENKERLIKLRADPVKYKEIYAYNDRLIEK
jgi:Rps23 Pro-64 3,4-dihydroxylase Tpa1-like proline 4-hydroxylase